MLRYLIVVALFGFTTSLLAPSETRAAEPVTTFYLGIDAASLALDSDRVPGVPTRSPGHAPRVGSIVLGLRFGADHAAEISAGADFSGEVDTDVLSIDGYRFFGDGRWRPFLTAGVSRFDVEGGVGGDSSQLQIGGGISAEIHRNLEFQAGYRHYFGLDGESFDDDAVNLALKWHFRGQPALAEAVAAVEPTPPAAAPAKEIARHELLVEFDFDRSEVKRLYEPQFVAIADIVRANPGIRLTIEGHTDAIGTEAYNQALSERRAGAVRDRFVAGFGVPPGRIDIAGFGESRPLAGNDSAEGRQRNRRAIAVVLTRE